jgi:hypothetical protein
LSVGRMKKSAFASWRIERFDLILTYISPDSARQSYAKAGSPRIRGEPGA